MRNFYYVEAILKDGLEIAGFRTLCVIIIDKHPWCYFAYARVLNGIFDKLSIWD